VPSGNTARTCPAARRFPPPWTIEESNNACFIVRDRHRQALALKVLRFCDKTNINEHTLFDSEESLLEMQTMRVFDLRT
jgi:hypothetical protein